MLDPSSWYLGLPIFPFENVEFTNSMDRFLKRYQFVGFASGLIYVLVVFSLQKWMRDRKAFPLTWFSICWNLLLTCLNVLAAVRIVPFLVSLLLHTTFYHSVCVDIGFLRDPVCAFWVRLFPFVKCIELGDTLLIVAEKRRLATYYWAHHLGALLFSWYLYPYEPSVAVWLTLIINVFHVPVYIYATLRSSKLQMPKMARDSLGFVEMVHMTINLVFCIILFVYIGRNANCNITVLNATLLTVIYALCLALTTHLFVQRLRYRSKVKAEKSIPTC